MNLRQGGHTSQLSRIKQRYSATDLSGGWAFGDSFTARRVDLASADAADSRSCRVPSEVVELERRDE